MDEFIELDIIKINSCKSKLINGNARFVYQGDFYPGNSVTLKPDRAVGVAIVDPNKTDTKYKVSPRVFNQWDKRIGTDVTIRENKENLVVLETESGLFLMERFCAEILVKQQKKVA